MKEESYYKNMREESVKTSVKLTLLASLAMTKEIKLILKYYWRIITAIKVYILIEDETRENW